MYCDRLGSDEFYLTHEFMANMLGVRRASVSVIAKQLQVEGLEAKTCEYYPVVKEEFDMLYTQTS
jgi:hypothetical protein